MLWFMQWRQQKARPRSQIETRFGIFLCNYTCLQDDIVNDDEDEDSPQSIPNSLPQADMKTVQGDPAIMKKQRNFCRHACRTGSKTHHQFFTTVLAIGITPHVQYKVCRYRGYVRTVSVYEHYTVHKHTEPTE